MAITFVFNLFLFFSVFVFTNTFCPRGSLKYRETTKRKKQIKIFAKNVFSAILFFKEVVFSLVVAVVVFIVVVIINAKRATRCKKRKSVRPLFGNRFIFSLSLKSGETKAVVSKAKPFVEKARNKHTEREELVFPSK